MIALLSFSRAIDRLAKVVSLLAAFVAFVSCFISAAKIVSRYMLDASSNSRLDV